MSQFRDACADTPAVFRRGHYVIHSSPTSGTKVVGEVVDGKWDGDFGEWVYEIEVPRKTRRGGTYLLRNCDEGSLRITTLAPTGLEQEDDEEEIARRPRRTPSIFTR